MSKLKDIDLVKTMNEISPEEQAKKILWEEKIARETKCLEEVKAALEKHKCKLDAIVVLGENFVRPEIKIVGL